LLCTDALAERADLAMIGRAQLLHLAVSAAAVLALSMLAAVVIERAVFAYEEVWRRRIKRRYLPIAQRALEGDADATSVLRASPMRHRVEIATLLITELIDDRDPQLIAKTRSLIQQMSLIPYAERLLRSRRWWRRALALRALGLIRDKDHTAMIVAALDDPDPHVRAAALDALADLQDPASLAAIVVRLNDMSLQRGRRLAALAAFGAEAEPRVLELAEIDPLHRADYARALALCGSQLSRSALYEWARERRVEVRAAAFRALASLGLDDRGAGLAIEALDSADADVRAMAAYALHGWNGSGDAASHLAVRLDDTWTVAVQAARSLEAMGPAGAVALQVVQPRSDLGAFLARQVLWQVSAS
jgi:HEAT repeat protein